MLTTQTINDRYAEGVDYLAIVTYNQHARALYGIQQRKKETDRKLLLLLYALQSWNNSPMAENTLTETQMMLVVEAIGKAQADNDVIRKLSSDKSLFSVPCGGNAFSLQIMDTSSVNLTLVNNVLSAVMRISSYPGNTIQLLPDGIFSSGSAGSGKTVKLITGADFTNATQYDDLSLFNTNFEVWHRGIGYLLYDRENPANPLNEYEVIETGGFNITIPGFDVNEGNNYFYIII